MNEPKDEMTADYILCAMRDRDALMHSLAREVDNATPESFTQEEIVAHMLLHKSRNSQSYIITPELCALAEQLAYEHRDLSVITRPREINEPVMMHFMKPPTPAPLEFDTPGLENAVLSTRIALVNDVWQERLLTLFGCSSEAFSNSNPVETPHLNRDGWIPIDHSKLDEGGAPIIIDSTQRQTFLMASAVYALLQSDIVTESYFQTMGDEPISAQNLPQSPWVVAELNEASDSIPRVRR